MTFHPWLTDDPCWCEWARKGGYGNRTKQPHDFQPGVEFLASLWGQYKAAEKVDPVVTGGWWANTNLAGKYY